MNLRVTAIGRLPQRVGAVVAPEGTEASRAIVGRRVVYFRGRGPVDTACYARDRLAPGMSFAGPAIVDQGDATTLVAPGFGARVDSHLNLVLERT